MRISIALGTFNGARYLEEQLNSIVAQTRRADEIVICDDASTDSTAEIAARYATRLIRNPQRLGTSRNFSQAISACTGDVIFLCDQDDVWSPKKIEVMSAAFESSAVACLFTDAQLNGGSLWDHIA